MTWPTFMNYEKDYDRQRRLSVDVHTVCKEHVAILGEKIVALEAKLAKARECIQWYADKGNWMDDYIRALNGNKELIYRGDGGEYARQTLKEIDA